MTDKELARKIAKIVSPPTPLDEEIEQIEAALRKHRAEVLREAAKAFIERHPDGVSIIKNFAALKLERMAAEAEEGK